MTLLKFETSTLLEFEMQINYLNLVNKQLLKKRGNKQDLS